MKATSNITNYQNLLNVIPPNITNEEIDEIKDLLVKYFAEKATIEANKFWDEKGFKSAKDMENYLNEK
jgi:hypothetical protein